MGSSVQGTESEIVAATTHAQLNCTVTDACAHETASAIGACLGSVQLSTARYEAVRLDVELEGEPRREPMTFTSENAASLLVDRIQVEWQHGDVRVDLTAKSEAQFAYEGTLTLARRHVYDVTCRR
jgi:hypothetical protein